MDLLQVVLQAFRRVSGVDVAGSFLHDFLDDVELDHFANVGAVVRALEHLVLLCVGAA